MANIDDLDYTSISEMSQEEALDMLRQIRLSRRVPLKSTRKSYKRTPKTSASQFSPEEAAKLLEKIGGLPND